MSDMPPKNETQASWPSATITLISSYYSEGNKKLVEFTAFFGAFVSLFLQVKTSQNGAEAPLRLVQAFLMLVFVLLFAYLLVTLALFIVSNMKRNHWTISLFSVTVLVSGFFVYNMGLFTYKEFHAELFQYWVAASLSLYVLFALVFDSIAKWVKENPDNWFSVWVTTASKVLRILGAIISLLFINFIALGTALSGARGSLAVLGILFGSYALMQIAAAVYNYRNKRKKFFQYILLIGISYLIVGSLVMTWLQPFFQ